MTAYLNIISRSRRQRRGGSPSVDGTAPRLQQQSISQVSQTGSHIKRYYLCISSIVPHMGKMDSQHRKVVGGLTDR